MSDYKLTSGQMSALTNFLNDGKSIYIEANDFGYYQAATPFYKMFGANYVADGNATNNVQTLGGEQRKLLEGTQNPYTYGGAYPDQYVDVISSNGGDMILKSQGNKGRVVAYAGPNGTYRTIYSTMWLGAIKNAGSNFTKAQIMDAYMRYLKQETLVVTIKDEISASTGGAVTLLLEQPLSEGNRPYAIFGSVTGTTPGIPVGSAVLPLNFDPFLTTVAGLWNTPAFTNFLGTLKAEGRQMANFDTLNPLDPSFVGVSFYFAYLLTAPIDTASTAAVVRIDP